MENSLLVTVKILSWFLCDVCVHPQGLCKPPGNISGGRYDPWKKFYEYGEKVEYMCTSPGYFLKGSKNRTCLNRRNCGRPCVGYWDNDRPECIKEEEEREFYERGWFLFLTMVFMTFYGWFLGLCWSLYKHVTEQRALSGQRVERERAEQDGSSSAAPAEPGAWTTMLTVGAQSQEQSGSPPIVENSMGSSPGGTEISVEQSQASVENPTDLPTYTQAVRVKPARPALSQPEDSRSLPSYTQAIRSPTTRVPLDLMENAMEMRQWNTPTGLPTYTHAVRAEAVRPAVQSLPWDTHTTRIEISIDYDNFAPRNITSHQFEKDD